MTATKGQQLSVDFALKQLPEPKNIVMHLEHCPFCGGHFSAVVLPTNSSVIIAQLALTAQKAAEYAVPVFASHPYVSPPAQAPPSLPFNLVSSLVLSMICVCLRIKNLRGLS